MPEEMVRSALYITEELKARIAELAEKERRSWNQMATILLEDHLEELESSELPEDTVVGVTR